MIEYAFPYGNSSGMTLRDYFAAQVLPILIKTMHPDGYDVDDTTSMAYFYADSMMGTRKDEE
jgi:hypothetical protein